MPLSSFAANTVCRASFFSRRTLLYLGGAVCILRLILNAVVPLTDPSEARYALICKIMAESGNYLEPKLIHEGVLMNFEGKPPLCFQAGALACRVFGVNLFAVRLPSFLFALGLLAVLYGTVRRLYGERTACMSALLTLSSVVFFLYSGMCMTDMALAFCVCAAVFSYMLFDRETAVLRKKAASIGFFAALALGMLVKGPVAIVMAGMPVFFYVLLGNRWRGLRHHAWILGSAVFLLIAAPWYVMMQRANPDFLYYFFVNENFKRFLFKEYGDQYGAGREFFRGMALIWFLLANLPAMLLLAFPLFRADARRRLAGFWRRQSLAESLPLLGFLAVVLFWCLTSRVLVTYLLPTVPLFSVWLACELERLGYAENRVFDRTVRLALPAVWAVVVLSFGSLRIADDYCFLTMPGDFFSQAVKEPGSVRFYFYRRVPYSAYFYLGERVVPHPEEDVQVSDANAAPYILIGRKHDLKKYPPSKPRRLLRENGVWSMYAPL